MPFFMEDDELLDPVDVGLFGAQTVMSSAHYIAHFIQKFGHGEAPRVKRFTRIYEDER